MRIEIKPFDGSFVQLTKFYSDGTVSRAVYRPDMGLLRCQVLDADYVAICDADGNRLVVVYPPNEYSEDEVMRKVAAGVRSLFEVGK